MPHWPRSLILVGAGKMGGAMLRGWLEGGLSAHDVVILEPSPSPETAAFAAERGVALNPDRNSLRAPDVLVLAIKPQSLEAAAPGLARLAGAGTLVFSIIAGKTIANLMARLPESRAVVRAMPNTPASIGRGATAAFANSAVSAEQRQWAETLARAVGRFHWLDAENQLDAVTAISGSGPAYIFALVEAMAAAGETLGLPAALAMSLARTTVEGAGELLYREPGVTAAKLRENVTSPAGTTAAALAVLKAPGGLDALMAAACAAARRRAGELAG
jgi:pyrroline-5-carboxylate reductase